MMTMAKGATEKAFRNCSVFTPHRKATNPPVMEYWYTIQKIVFILAMEQVKLSRNVNDGLFVVLKSFNLSLSSISVSQVKVAKAPSSKFLF